jgi:hypothetical protein
VLTPSGAPIEGADVAVFYFTQEPRAEHRYAARSGPDGGYEIQGVPPGRFRVLARKAGFSNMTTHPGQLNDGVMIDLDAGGAVSGVDLVMRPTGTIAGRVLRPDGTPVAQARVGVQVRQPDGKLMGLQAPTVTGADGRYRLENTPPGSYVVTATYSVLHEMLGRRVPGSYQEWARTFHPATTEFDRATRIDIRGGESLTGVDIVLQPEMTHGLSGTVAAENGKVPRNARVAFTTDRSSGFADVFGEGLFVIGGLRSGQVTLQATGETDDGAVHGEAVVDIIDASVEGVRIVMRRVR